MQRDEPRRVDATTNLCPVWGPDEPVPRAPARERGEPLPLCVRGPERVGVHCAHALCGFACGGGEEGGEGGVEHEGRGGGGEGGEDVEQEDGGGEGEGGEREEGGHGGHGGCVLIPLRGWRRRRRRRRGRGREHARARWWWWWRGRRDETRWARAWMRGKSACRAGPVNITVLILIYETYEDDSMRALGNVLAGCTYRNRTDGGLERSHGLVEARMVRFHGMRVRIIMYGRT